MEKQNEKARINLYVAKHLVEFLDQQAEELGVNRSAMISVLIKNYKDQQEVITMTQMIQRYDARDIEDLKKKMDEQKGI